MYCVKPSPISGRLRAPPSKPMAQRHIFASAIAEGVTVVKGLEHSDDVVAALRAAAPLSEISLRGSEAVVRPRTPDPERAFNVGESGFTYRIAAALYAGIPGKTVIYAAGSLARRPIAELVDALRKYAEIEQGPGFVKITGRRLGEVEVEVPGHITSQYISGLMFLAAVAERGGAIKVRGERKSWQYVKATADVLRRFGAYVEIDEAITVKGPLKSPGLVETPGDYALSAFYMVGASITGGRAVVEGLSEGPDKEILDILREFGVGVHIGERLVEVEGPPTTPVDVNLANAPDLAPPVALLASFAPGVSKIRGVEHLAYKESNRIETIIDVVRRAGASAEYEGGVLRIAGPAGGKGAEYKCHGDHRICLMALIAARALGGCVDDLSPIAKSWPTALLSLLG